jgi:hypothetical protein
MQTFLPLPSFRKSLECLDYKRLGKQRVESMQILNCLHPESTSSWRHHPAVLMWKGYEPALQLYMNIAIETWVARGYKNTMPLAAIKSKVLLPWWFGLEEFHASHRSNLLRKNIVYYGQFGWKESTDLPYWWPKR